MYPPFQVDVASPPDRERLVAMISFGNVQWAELHLEQTEPTVEFYPGPDGDVWELPLSSVLAALNEAKSRIA